MRCYACNEELSDYEATRKSNITKDYIDLCDVCFSTVEELFIDVEGSLNLEEFMEKQNEQISSP